MEASSRRTVACRCARKNHPRHRKRPAASHALPSPRARSVYVSPTRSAPCAETASSPPCSPGAADAVRGRIDWKYALGLALTDPGFDHTVLSEFRTRLVEGQAELLLLDALLRRLQEEGLVKARGRQRTDSTHVLAAVRGLNRLEQRVGETLRAGLNELATVAPGWLREVAPVTW